MLFEYHVVKQHADIVIAECVFYLAAAICLESDGRYPLRRLNRTLVF